MRAQPVSCRLWAGAFAGLHYCRLWRSGGGCVRCGCHRLILLLAFWVSIIPLEKQADAAVAIGSCLAA